MSGLFTVVVVMCASALICSLVQTFVTDGSKIGRASCRERV